MSGVCSIQRGIEGTFGVLIQFSWCEKLAVCEFEEGAIRSTTMYFLVAFTGQVFVFILCYEDVGSMLLLVSFRCLQMDGDVTMVGVDVVSCQIGINVIVALCGGCDLANASEAKA